jgi:ATP-dependent Zn protease
MKKSNDYTIKQAMDQFVDRYQISEKLEEASLKNNWEAIFGKTINKHTTNISLQQKTLSITINLAVLKSELNFNKDKIKDLANQFLQKEVVAKVVIY